MNDRFKFRVWNNKHNRYIVDSHYPIGSDHIIVVKQDGKVYNLGLGDYEDYSNMHSWAVMEEFTDCILEQCTGLKDKNGNLIYENDLIKTANYKTGLPEIYVVKWCDECGIYQLESTQSDQIIDMYRAEKGIICGNIHEQAEQKDVK